MRAKSILKYLLVVAIATVLAVSCEDPYKPIDYSQLEKDELELLEKYLDKNLVALKTGALNTIINDTLHYFEMEKGVGDSIQKGDIVGFRYNYYKIIMGDDDKPALNANPLSNYSSESPHIYVVGDASNKNFPGVGIDKGIRYMRHLGKSKMIIKSQYDARNYYTLFAEIEVTHLIRD